MSRGTVACVLRTGGGTFAEEWVERLAAGVRMFSPSMDVVCLTDSAQPMRGVRVLPLRHALPGWWSKLELFAPGNFPAGEPVLYLDLDTLPVGPLEGVVRCGTEPVVLISDLFNPKLRQSGAMVIRPGAATARLWDAFRALATEIMGRYAGDGQWLHSIVPPGPTVQQLCPGLVASLKVTARLAPPPGAVLVLGHGRPRFTDPAAGWAAQEWARRGPQEALQGSTAPGACPVPLGDGGTVSGGTWAVAP